MVGRNPTPPGKRADPSVLFIPFFFAAWREIFLDEVSIA
jgi:hypothetical protein